MGPGRGAGRTCLEVGELQKLVRLAALEIGQHFAAGLRLAEGWQALLAALEAVRSAQQASEEAQLRVAGEVGGGIGLGHRAAVAVAEGLAVAQQAVQPQADLQVAHALCPVLAAVLVQRVPIGRLEWHQLVPGEATKAVALVLGAPGARRTAGAQQHQQSCGRPAPRFHRARRKEPSEKEKKEENGATRQEECLGGGDARLWPASSGCPSPPRRGVRTELLAWGVYPGRARYPLVPALSNPC